MDAKTQEVEAAETTKQNAINAINAAQTAANDASNTLQTKTIERDNAGMNANISQGDLLDAIEDITHAQQSIVSELQINLASRITQS